MKIAFVFPGQGSQSVGMLDSFADNAVVHDIMAQADAALGESLSGLIKLGPAEQLNLTTHTQPAMLASSVAMYRAWLAAGGALPALVAGHSLGEFTALVAAGALGFEDAVRVVRARANAMQEAVPVGTGAMAAILGLSDDEVRAACADAAAVGVVEAVNYNAPAQVVIAGAKAAVEKACEAAKARGAKRALPLPVSAPFHSSLMQPAAKVLEGVLATVEIKTPGISLINNVDVAVVSDPAGIRSALVRQAAGAVRWVETIQSMQQSGVTHVVECGPGKVLQGLCKRIAPEVQALSISDATSLSQALETLK